MDADQFVRIAKALADPRRFQILEEIAARQDVACQRLCEESPVAQPTVSHHLKELATAGLVESRREGQFVYYRYRADVMREYVSRLETRLGLRERREAGDPEGAAGATPASTAAE